MNEYFPQILIKKYKKPKKINLTCQINTQKTKFNKEHNIDPVDA